MEPPRGAGGEGGGKRGHAGRQGSKDASNGATKWRLVILQLHKSRRSDVSAYTHIKSWELKTDKEGKRGAEVKK